MSAFEFILALAALAGPVMVVVGLLGDRHLRLAHERRLAAAEVTEREHARARAHACHEQRRKELLEFGRQALAMLGEVAEHVIPQFLGGLGGLPNPIERATGDAVPLDAQLLDFVSKLDQHDQDVLEVRARPLVDALRKPGCLRGGSLHLDEILAAAREVFERLVDRAPDWLFLLSSGSLERAHKILCRMQADREASSL